MTRVLLSLMVVTACAEPAGPATRRDAVVGGDTDAGAFAEVLGMAIFYGAARPNEYYGCSAVLISPTIALTAAHCLDETILADAGIRRVMVTPRPSMTSAVNDVDWIEVARWRRTPEWTPTFLRVRDLGILQLARPVANVVPAPPFKRPLAPRDVGRPMDVVGYGRRVATLSTSARVRAVASMPLKGVTSEHIQLGVGGTSGVCTGDSGGPSFVTDADGVRRVVGIHSWTFNDAGCTNGLDTRVDLYGDFIADFVADAGAASCDDDLICVPGCAPVDQDCACAADGACNPACVNELDDPDCPQSCAADGYCTTVACADPDPDCAPAFATCATNTSCASRVCATDETRNERYCTSRCADGCPDGTSCFDGACLLTPAAPIEVPRAVSERPQAGCSSTPGSLVAIALSLFALRRR